MASNANGEPSGQGHEYGTTTNHGTLHQGNIYNTYLANVASKIDCRDALLLNDPFIHREALKREKGRRASGTCEWIRKNEAYQSWLEGDGQCLWICGGPGKGKTMLSIFLTEELESKPIQSTTSLFFFCINGDKGRSNSISVLRGLAYQLLTKHPSLSKHVLSYFETTKKTESTLSSPEALWMMFKTLLQAPELGTVFCVLDGLDECDDKSIENLVKQFRDFYSLSDHPSQTNQILKVAIVSRKINGLDVFPQVHLDPDNDNYINEDIKQFISTRTQELPQLPGFDDDFRRNIEDILLRRSEGTFLWIGFVMYELLKSKTCTEMTDVLDALPRGLPAMYGRMLKQVKSSQRRIISSILICVTLVLVPMTLEELKAAVSLLCDTSTPSSQTMRDQIASCGPILQIHGRRGEVSFVHQSVRDYLLREEVDNDPILEEFRIKKGKGHANLARIFLDCIEESDFRHRPMEVSGLYADASVLRKWPLLGYASAYWPEHVGKALDADEFIDLSRPFFQKYSSVRHHWWISTTRGNIRDIYDPPPLLQLASYLGIDSLARKLLTTNAWYHRLRKPVNKKIGNFATTALILATQRGRMTMVQLLLANGANVNTKDKLGNTALAYAAEKGFEKIVELLLEYRADVNTKDRAGDTALSKAATGGHEAIVQQLLGKGADAKKSGTAILDAAIRGHKGIVELLLTNGADVNLQNRVGNTALINATEGGCEAIVQLLLENGADVNIKDNYKGRTALMKAVEGGHEAIVRQLLENGAEINIKDNRGKTALSKAVVRGHKAIAQLLLERGADTME